MSEFLPMYLGEVDHEQGSVTFVTGYAPEVEPFDGDIAHNLYRYMVLQGTQLPVTECWPQHGIALQLVAPRFYSSEPPESGL